MATNIPSYTGDMPDLASQGQEEISQNMTNFANYINALPTPLNTLASEVEALEQQTENNAAIATTKSNESASNAASAAASANQASTYADALDGQNLNLMTESEFQALSARRREQYAASGFVEVSGGDVNQGIQSVTNASNQMTIKEALKQVNGVSTRIPETIIDLPDSSTVEHADSTNSGLVVNGTGLTGTTFTQSVTISGINQVHVIEYTDNGTSKRLEVTPTATPYNISLSGTDVTSVAMYPKSALSRQDLVFLEFWDEDISEKGNIVYPYGNVQYRGGNVDGLTGIADGSFTGADTYSLFGNWQTAGDLVGKGYDWDTLTDAQKAAFAGNPEHNLRKDGDKIIQTRYRIRVVEGLGDEWNFDTLNNTNGTATFGTTNGSIVTQAQGKAVNLPNGDLAALYTNRFLQADHANGKIESQIGSFGLAVSGASLAYKGRCYAMPIALVQRRNQGSWHPIFNMHGTKAFQRTTNDLAARVWYHTDSVTPESTIDCFRFSTNSVSDGTGSLAQADGNVDFYGSLVRPDGKFYDAVYSSDIIDLRNSAHEKPKAELLEDIKRLLISGEKRSDFDGDGVWETTALPVAPYQRWIEAGVVASYLQQSTHKQSGQKLHCDILANPSNYGSWADALANGYTLQGTPLLVSEEGDSMLPDGVETTFKLSNKATAVEQVLKSTDNGVTWATASYTLNSTANTITFSTAPAVDDLIMVNYTTTDNPTYPAVNSECLEIGDVWAGNDASSKLVPSLINKVPEKPASISYPTYVEYKLDSEGIKSAATGVLLSRNYGGDVTHSLPVDFSAFNVVDPAVKALFTLSQENGRYVCDVKFKEMKYDGTWGDADNKIDIVDNVTTTIDTNGNTILIGNKRVKTNYFVKEK
jgi:hypothetical protein